MENWSSVSKKVAIQLEEMIASSDDGRLPSQRELSTRLGVSRPSIREALSLLEASGKIRTEPGRGTFRVSAAHRNGAGAEHWTGPADAQPHPSQRTYPKSEISRFRYLIEGQSGRLAAMRITDDEIRQLEGNLAVFKTQTRSMNLDASARTDFEFHQMIVDFSGVRLFSDLHLLFRNVIMQAVQMYQSQHTRAWEPVAEHEKIIEALKRRDPDEALYYLHSHIVRSADRLGIIDANAII
jgi:GntR family transcriptional regulator, transcriptional repressor for pyruvate dehydrogenase complex